MNRFIDRLSARGSKRSMYYATPEEIKKYELIDDKIADFMQKSGFERSELEFIEFMKKGQRHIKRVVIFRDKRPIFHIEVMEVDGELISYSGERENGYLCLGKGEGAAGEEEEAHY